MTQKNTSASYTGCSCYKIGDQGDLWLSNELLKKTDLLFSFLLAYFTSIRASCNGSSARAGCVWPQASAGCPTANSHPSCCCMGQRMACFFLSWGRWPVRARDFTWLLPTALIGIDVTQKHEEAALRQYLKWQNRFRGRCFSCLRLGWVIFILFCLLNRKKIWADAVQIS